MAEKEALIITGIRFKNFLGLKEIALSGKNGLDPRINLFVGKNAQGKTDIIRGIRTAFEGSTDTTLIREGEDASELYIDISNGMQVARKLTRKGGNYVNVLLNEDGDKKAKPQEYIKSLLGNFPFDPIEFLTTKDRAEYIRKLFSPKVTEEQLKAAGVGEDKLKMVNLADDGFKVLDLLAEKIYYVERSEVNKTVTSRKALLDEAIQKLGEYDPQGYDPKAVETFRKSVDDLQRQLTEAEAVVRQAEANKEKRGKVEARLEQAKAELAVIPADVMEQLLAKEKERDELEAQIRKLQDDLGDVMQGIVKLKTMRDETGNLKQAIEAGEETLKALTIENVPDVEHIKDELEAAKMNHQIAVKSKERYDLYGKIEEELRPQYDSTKKRSDDLTALIKKLREDLPAEITKTAKIPIEGLKLNGDTVMIGDRNLDHMSKAEQVGIVLSIERELNKDVTLKVFCLDGVECLDDATLAEFTDQIRNNEFQYFCTMVQHGDYVPPGGLVMENGEIKQPKKEHEGQGELC